MGVCTQLWGTGCLDITPHISCICLSNLVAREQMSCWRYSLLRAPSSLKLSTAGVQAERWPASCWFPWALALALLCVCQWQVPCGGAVLAAPVRGWSVQGGESGCWCKGLLKGKQVVQKKGSCLFRDQVRRGLEGLPSAIATTWVKCWWKRRESLT